MNVILTCEHFSRRVPRSRVTLYAGADETLHSHRGWDIGAPGVFRALEPLAVAAFRGRWSRLLVDLNRSEHHPHCLSEFTRPLPKSERQRLIEKIHRPFRQNVLAAIDAQLASGATVLHLSVHTFTPVLADNVRHADIGLLYDPSRKGEREFAGRWAAELPATWSVRRNYPYRGTADGHTTALRRLLPPDRYLGIELEVNQRMAARPETVGGILRSFSRALQLQA